MNELFNPETSTLSHSLREDIELLVTDIQSASQKSVAVTQQADAFSHRGFWAQLSGSLTGRNDVDLSQMIGAVGESLQVTQRVVEILLKIQSEKNVVLKDFHRAVTEKIVDLQSNDDTLDLNLRDNLLDVFQHLQKQVEDKLEQAAMVEAQKIRIAKMEYELQQQEAIVTAASRDVDRMTNALECALQQVDEQRKTVDVLEEKIDNLSNQLTIAEQRLSTLPSEFRTRALNKRDYLLFVVSVIVVVSLGFIVWNK
jgi:chromosome segregation ATPase